MYECYWLFALKFVDLCFCSFLVAKEKGTSRPVAFVSYRYDIDEGDEVVYW